MDIGSSEIFLILLVALLLYGGRLPEVARSLGRSIASLKRGLMESTADVKHTLDSAMEDVDEVPDEPARPRTVKRIRPAPAALATEDITTAPANGDSGPAAPTADPADGKPRDPGSSSDAKS